MHAVARGGKTITISVVAPPNISVFRGDEDGKIERDVYHIEQQRSATGTIVQDEE